VEKLLSEKSAEMTSILLARVAVLGCFTLVSQSAGEPCRCKQETRNQEDITAN